MNWNTKTIPPMTNVEEQLPDTSAPLVEHLRELRNRLIWGLGAVFVFFLACYGVKEQLFTALTHPLIAAGQKQMVFTAVHELFFTYLKLSLLGGLYLGIPVLLVQIWKFMAPGLYKSEKRVVLPLLIATPVLFYLGGIFTYFAVLPIALKFFLSFSNAEIVALPSVKEYLSFLISMTFAFGIAFELPIFLLLLVKAGLVTPQALSHFRRYAYVLILTLAAILTPPDPVSQLLLGVPMMVLYEIAVFLAKGIKSSGE